MFCWFTFKICRMCYFIIFTANPAWHEVTSALRPGEHAHDRPDLIARVFHIKFQSRLKELFDEEVLGKMIAYCWVVEFQKRGLPHAHILMNVQAADKVKTAADIDARVCAEFPPRSHGDQQELYSIIKSSMVHGP